ncbi:MAG: hypothetical protein JO032_21415 [Alphaproteobacteria bacterium]|nr:hypothetical protein [Alphaproteobacteria bacterium]MBV9555348.1 hypothetical protein [Alphaproteobacteria bacterium]
MSRFSVVALVVLAACTTADVDAVDAVPSNTGIWRLSSGKSPSQAEWAALEATCQYKGAAIEPCLADLGLKRSP